MYVHAFSFDFFFSNVFLFVMHIFHWANGTRTKWYLQVTPSLSLDVLFFRQLERRKAIVACTHLKKLEQSLDSARGIEYWARYSYTHHLHHPTAKVRTLLEEHFWAKKNTSTFNDIPFLLVTYSL